MTSSGAGWARPRAMAWTISTSIFLPLTLPVSRFRFVLSLCRFLRRHVLRNLRNWIRLCVAHQITKQKTAHTSDQNHFYYCRFSKYFAKNPNRLSQLTTSIFQLPGRGSLLYQRFRFGALWLVRFRLGLRFVTGWTGHRQSWWAGFASRRARVAAFPFALHWRTRFSPEGQKRLEERSK